MKSVRAKPAASVDQDDLPDRTHQPESHHHRREDRPAFVYGRVGGDRALVTIRMTDVAEWLLTAGLTIQTG